MKLNYLQMLKDIDALVQTDFMFNMDCRMIPDSKPYTQKEAKKMAHILGNVYLISHCLHCSACQKKYATK